MSKRNHLPMKAPAEYRVVADGINWPDPSAPPPEDPTHTRRENRAERGDMVRDLPPEVEKTLLEHGHIESLEEPIPPPVPAAAAEEAKE